MTTHKLKLGKELIESLYQLGKTLKYHVEKEFPVQDSSSNPPAIDVAWFANKNDSFPLFIFEVESNATNSIANNPLKVFSQDNKEFEKPLFYFHVVAKGGKNSSRIKNLELQYGRNNYRIYLVGNDSATSLLKDIINQHSRIRNEFDYSGIHKLLISGYWSSHANYVEILKHAASLELSERTIVSSYISLCRKDPLLIKDLILIIETASSLDWQNADCLDSYLGQSWSIPIFCSLLIGQSKNSNDLKKWNDKLLQWQHSTNIPQITPAFGLSCDYDEFILSCAPQLITLCIVLAKGQGTFCKEFINILLETLNKVGCNWAGLNSAIYLLHLSARLNLKKEYNFSKTYIEEYANLSYNNIIKPPSCTSVFEGSFEDYYELDKHIAIPSLKSFFNQFKNVTSLDDNEILSLALLSLDDDTFIYECSPILIDHLWKQY